MSRLCGGRVIELGCGSGELTAMISRRGHDVMGVDINRDKILAARTRFPGVRFEQQDIREIVVDGERFDTVVLAEVLEHVNDAVGHDMLTIAWALLRPGGRLIVSVPNENCIPHPNHVRAFNRASLRAMLEEWGRPRTMTDQPYKWLLMYVTKPEATAAVAS
jgi:2-polyprenyl-3-methyl-5-hydroxy-6-metoxy-1,4-benzoquinol methylase